MPFLNSASEILGELDHRHRPHVDVWLLIAGQRQVVRCQVDTGSDDALIFESLEVAEKLGLTFRRAPHNPREDRRLANGSMASFVKGMATVDLFGQRTCMVLAPDPLGADPNISKRVLLGVPLLIGAELSLRFFGSPGAVKLQKGEALSR